MRPAIISLLAACLLISGALAQNQHNRWYFGAGAGLDFSSGNPVAVSDGQTLTQESASTISDASGNLLFYTDGINAWNANHNLMLNGSGLLGNESSQCMIVPKPGNPNVYYILTTDANYQAAGDGLRYSEVDMTLDGGLGAVTATKNILLNAENGEWLTAIPHANCVDTWILSHGVGSSSQLMAYHLSSTGIDPVPVVSDLGLMCAAVGGDGIGIMRPHPSGDFLAMTSRPQGGFNPRTDLVNFNRATGVATMGENLFTGAIVFTYGVEFSRSGNVLYAGEDFGKIFQYDITAADVSATRTQIGSFQGGEIGQLQLAPNDKIYVNYNIFPAGGTTIGAINNPENLGVACNYVSNVVSVTGITVYGLPWYYNPSGNQQVAVPDLGADTTLCSGSALELTPGIPVLPGSTLVWSDGSQNEQLTVTASGTYWLDYDMGACGIHSDTIAVWFDTNTLVYTPFAVSDCVPFTVSLPAPSDVQGLLSWQWQTGTGASVVAPDNQFVYTDPGNFTLTLTGTTVNDCPVTAAFPSQVAAFSPPQVGMEWNPDPVVADEPVVFDALTSPGVVGWLWEFGDQTISTLEQAVHTFSIGDDLRVSLTVTDNNGCEATINRTVVMEEETIFFVPNAFTPDANGRNEVFAVVDPFGIVNGISIYNRWGETVWSARGSSATWDGRFNGKPVPEGVYTWQVSVAINGVSTGIYEGHVSVLR